MILTPEILGVINGAVAYASNHCMGDVPCSSLNNDPHWDEYRELGADIELYNVPVTTLKNNRYIKIGDVKVDLGEVVSKAAPTPDGGGPNPPGGSGFVEKVAMAA